MYTKQDYLKGKCNHREYYSQFVNDNVKQMIIDRIGKDKIINSKDENFNDIPLKIWDNIGLPYGICDLLHQVGDFYTLGGQVCILKEASRQIKDKYKINII